MAVGKAMNQPHGQAPLCSSKPSLHGEHRLALPSPSPIAPSMDWSWLRGMVELTREPLALNEDRRAWAESMASTTCASNICLALRKQAFLVRAPPVCIVEDHSDVTFPARSPSRASPPRCLVPSSTGSSPP